MKTNNNNLLATLSSNTLKALTTVVNETVATTEVKKFSAASLWNIQRSKKLATIRRAFAY